MNITRLITAGINVWNSQKEKRVTTVFMWSVARLCVVQNERIPVAGLNLLDSSKISRVLKEKHGKNT